jgi:putative aminopeptidase FrvX
LSPFAAAVLHLRYGRLVFFLHAAILDFMSTEAASLKLIEELTLAAGLPGFEGEVTGIFRRELGPHCDVDRIGNSVCTVEPASVGERSSVSILFAAHQDEIGFMVASVLAGGFLRLQPLGGWNPVTLPASPVTVINREGERFPGIIGYVPPHFAGNREGSLPAMEELFVDIGALSADEVHGRFGVYPGDLVVPVTRFAWNRRSRTLCSKAFDDRIGIAALIETAARVREIPERANRLLFAATVQEEVGTRGAAVLGGSCEADVVIVVEGAPADDIPGGPETAQTRLGGGAHVRIFDPTMIAHPRLLAHVRAVAAQRGIRIQESVRRGGGTDAKVLHLAGAGKPAVVLGVPVRYAHSHNSMICLDDYLALLDLLEALCLSPMDL